MGEVMTNKTIKHEIKLQTSVIVILGILAIGVFANAFGSAFSIKGALANHQGYSKEIGSVMHPLTIVCKEGCK